MSSSPRFWQKLGLGKQQKTSSSSSTVNSGTLVTRFRNIKAQAQFFFFFVRETRRYINTLFNIFSSRPRGCSFRKWESSETFQVNLIFQISIYCVIFNIYYSSSNLTLRHRASSASLHQQMVQSPTTISEKPMRRLSHMKPLRRIDPPPGNNSKFLFSYKKKR
jgi:hypothetical protein